MCINARSRARAHVHVCVFVSMSTVNCVYIFFACVQAHICAHALVFNCIVAVEFGIKTLFIFIHTIVVNTPACFLAHENVRGGERDGGEGIEMKGN